MMRDSRWRHDDTSHCLNYISQYHFLIAFALGVELVVHLILKLILL